MNKYGNSNYEKRLDEEGRTLVSDEPITDEMEKEAKEKGEKDKNGKSEVININDREVDE